ncbi:MAG: hypothetical protein HC888_03050 [Candidatus Competibacteraceae bacterium]|nr:hypothetical protein [Candidatus Competibacteraceae bacterium]
MGRTSHGDVVQARWGSLRLYYENGKLIRAGLRPRDGINGEDITAHVRHVQGIPHQLPLPLNCSIRGEIECRKSVFEKLNGSATVDEQEFANPRNYTAGSLGQENLSVVAKRGLSFVGYSIENIDKPPYKTARERAIWVSKTLKVPFIQVETFKYSSLLELEAKANDLDYEVDGVIIELDDLDMQEQAGRSGDRATGNPRGKIAWKFDDETADVVIDALPVETGRTGRITPVATFKGVTLAGTVVTRCSAHSYGFLARNSIKVGTKIRIRKSGKIIPEILGVYDDKGNFVPKIEAGDDNIQADFDAIALSIAPKVCPACLVGTKLVHGQTRGMLDVVCDSKECPAQNVKTYIHYLQGFGVKGVADEVVTALAEAGKVKRFADFYELSVSDIKGAGVSLRKSLLAVARIHMIHEPEKIKDDQQLAKMVTVAVQNKKHIALDKLIACLGISGASKGTGRDLAAHFRSFNRILDACETDFAAVANVGDKTAKSLCDYFTAHRDDLRRLLDHVEIELPKDGKLSGKTFVFTGSMPVERRMLEDMVQQEGGKVASSVSKRTDYVVVGNDPGSKYDKAQELAKEGHPISILDYNALVALVDL